MSRIALPWRVVLIFVLLVLLSNMALDTVGSALATNSDEWGALQQLRACEHQSHTPDVVVLGTSRAQAGIAPPILSAQMSEALGRHIVVCDVAVTTSVPLEDRYMLRQLLADGVHPRLVVYATAEFTYNSDIAQSNTPVRDNIEYLARLSDLPDLLQTSLGDPAQGQWNTSGAWYLDFIATRLFRLYADRRGIQIAVCQLIPAFGPCPGIVPQPATTVASPATPRRTYPIDAAQGWYPLPEMTARSLQNSQQQYSWWLSAFHVAPDALQALAAMADLARSAGCGFVVITTPLLPRHLAFFPQVADYSAYLDTLYQFSAQHHMPFYDTEFRRYR